MISIRWFGMILAAIVGEIMYLPNIFNRSQYGIVICGKVWTVGTSHVFSRNRQTEKMGELRRFSPQEWVNSAVLVTWLPNRKMGMGQNPIPLVNIKIAGKWMFIP